MTTLVQFFSELHEAVILAPLVTDNNTVIVTTRGVIACSSAIEVRNGVRPGQSNDKVSAIASPNVSQVGDWVAFIAEEGFVAYDEIRHISSAGVIYFDSGNCDRKDVIEVFKS